MKTAVFYIRIQFLCIKLIKELSDVMDGFPIFYIIDGKV